MKIYYKTFGCRVNQIETESLSEKFASAGATREEELFNCDMVFINSCSVTEKADRDVLSLIKKAASLNKKIAITGCYSSLFPEEVLKIAPSAVIISNSEKHLAPAILFKAASNDDFFSVKGSHGRTRAFVKVQDGCLLKCSYCIVPYGRSKLSSKPYEKALAEISGLVNSGFREITLSGTRLGCYKCPEKGYGLKELLSGVLAISGNFRIRLSSLEPMEIDESLLSLCSKAGGKFCDHFHLPIQHCCDSVLKDMRRPYNFAFVKERISMIRSFFPQAGIFADIISSFPSETDEDFEIMKNRLSELRLSGLHAFTYSPRPFTPAASMSQLPEKIKRERSKAARALDSFLRSSFALSMRGKKLRVLTIGKKDGATLSLSSNFLNVLLPQALARNEFYEAEIRGVSLSFLTGEIL
ncbi:MAG: tRNA (N(6)-L-threonylcarbamoyladenosine(37)-C(2))-methylthiotransferase MtaB [Elusimicrobiota bacterium]